MMAAITAEQLQSARRLAHHRANRRARRLPLNVDREALSAAVDVALWKAETIFERGSFVPFAQKVAANYWAEELRRQSPLSRGQQQKVREAQAAGRDLNGWMLPSVSLDTPIEIPEYGREYLADTLEAPGDFTVGVIRRQILERALSRLRPRWREVMERYYLREESTAEIAEAMHISDSRVNGIRYEALVRLKERL